MNSEKIKEGIELLEPLGDVTVGVFDVGILYIANDNDAKIPPAVGKKMKALGFSPRKTTWMGEERGTFYTITAD